MSKKFKVPSDHPKAIEAAERAAFRNMHRAQINRAISHDGVRFVHVEVYTICYKPVKKHVLEISTSLCNPTDRYDKIEGRIQALRRFANGNRVFVRMDPEFESAKAFLTYFFQTF